MPTLEVLLEFLYMIDFCMTLASIHAAVQGVNSEIVLNKLRQLEAIMQHDNQLSDQDDFAEGLRISNQCRYAISKGRRQESSGKFTHALKKY